MHQFAIQMANCDPAKMARSAILASIGLSLPASVGNDVSGETAATTQCTIAALNPINHPLFLSEWLNGAGGANYYTSHKTAGATCVDPHDIVQVCFQFSLVVWLN